MPKMAPTGWSRGVRPSSGAATPGRMNASDLGSHSRIDIAAPEDGRTPGKLNSVAAGEDCFLSSWCFLVGGWEEKRRAGLCCLRGWGCIPSTRVRCNRGPRVLFIVVTCAMPRFADQLTRFHVAMVWFLFATTTWCRGEVGASSRSMNFETAPVHPIALD